MSRTPALLVLMSIALLLALIGCDEDEATAPLLGMVVVNGSPDVASPAWQLRLPGNLYAVGEGDSTLLEMKSGTYTLTWQEIEGWQAPDPASTSLSLGNGGSVVFTGTYTRIIESRGTIIVDPDPDDVDASWSLAGPNGYSHDGTGYGELLNLELGEYTLNWGSRTGWTLVSAADTTATLTADEHVVFTGVYTSQSGTVTVVPRGNLTAPWRLVVQDTITEDPFVVDEIYSYDGTGNEVLSDLPANDYIVYWQDVTGWMTPETLTQKLVPGGSISFEDDYILQYTTVTADVFGMGSDIASDETLHDVTLSRSFTIRTTEITNQEFCDMLNWAEDNGHVDVELRDSSNKIIDLIDGSNQVIHDLLPAMTDFNYNSNSGFSCRNPGLPVSTVNWYAAVCYCDWLNLRDGDPQAYDHSDWSVTGGDLYAQPGWRLPTEAEWEFACRAGNTTAFSTGTCLDGDLDANFNGGSQVPGCAVSGYTGQSVTTGSYPANAYGLHDMHGNLAEWCADWYDPSSYGAAPVTNPSGPATGTERVVRGGGYFDGAWNCRSAARSASEPDQLRFWIGFRIVKSD